MIALWDAGRVAIGFKAGCQPPDWDALKAADEKKARRGTRLLYVACTRARDLLVIPVPPGDARRAASGAPRGAGCRRRATRT